MKHVLFLIILSLHVSGALAASPASLYARCESSKVPLFANPNPNDVLTVTVMTDYAGLNRRRHDVEMPAVLAVRLSQGLDFVPVILKQRGGVRRDACSARPFKITFLRKAIETQIESQLIREKIVPGSMLYLKKYYHLLKDYGVNILRDGDGQKGNLFEGLGKDLKVVTHCGETDGARTYRNVGWITQNRRVLAEYYIYKMLMEFKAVTEDAKLARVMYVSPDGAKIHTNKDGQGRIIHSNFAILREPKKVLAKRCGLLTQMPENMRNLKIVNLNNVSHYQLYFLNSFIGNFDFGQENDHNVEVFYDSKGEAFHSAYDFDLAYGASPEYEPLSKDVFTKFDNDVNFQTTLKESRRAMYSKAIEIQPKLNAMIENSLMATEQKDRFYSWFFDVYKMIKAPAKKSK